MATYFVDPYKKYYDGLSAATQIVSSANTLLQNAMTVSTTLNRLQTQISSARWEELGYQELKNTAIPLFLKRIDTFQNNISSSVVKASELAINDLLKLLTSLKEKDASYEDVVNKIKSAGFFENKSDDKAKKASLEKEIDSLKSQIDAKISEIKALNSQIIDFEGTDVSGTISEVEGLALTSEESKHYDTLSAALVSSGVASVYDGKTPLTDGLVMVGGVVFGAAYNEKKTESTGTVGEISEVISGTGNTATLNALNGTWTVVNTVGDVSTYAKHVAKQKIAQNNNSSIYGGYCLAFSYIHASNMYNGQTNDTAKTALSYKHASEFENYQSDSKSDTLKKVYYEIMNGRPVVMQVNGNKQGTSRHFVTVLGFKDSVTSAETLKEEDLLIMDSWDGNVERMDTNGSRFMITGADCNKDYSGYYLRVLKA